MEMTTPTPRQVKVVDLTDLVPAEWDWFWDMLGSANPDFSFGDNNLTLIAGERFARFIDDAYEWFSSDEDVETCSEGDWFTFVDTIWYLNKEQIYINMES
jgi:hypothetical protein